MITRREKHVAEAIAHRLPPILAKRGLKPAFRDFGLAEVNGLKFLLAEMDMRQVDYPERYTSPEVLAHLRMETGYRVYLSRAQGLRYVLLLSPLPKLPKQVDYPADAPAERVTVGVGANGMISETWQKLGHMLAAGQTGSGKSAFLRLIVYQALRDGMKLLLADMDQATFPMLTNHAALLRPIAVTPQETLALIRFAAAECDRRSVSYREANGFQYNECLTNGNHLSPDIIIT